MSSALENPGFRMLVLGLLGFILTSGESRQTQAS
jgi:hypothetical protein